MTYKFKKKVMALILCCYFFACEPIAAQQNYSQYVNPLIGSVGLGHIFVGPSCPYGMVKPGPDCGSGGSNSGYLPNMKEPVIGFSQVHVSGTGGGAKYGNIQLMPFSGDSDSIYQSSLRENEVAKLAYYGVLLTKHNIKVELTTTEKAALHRYTFAKNAKQAIKIDAGFFLGDNIVPDAREAQQFVGSEIQIVSDTEVCGYSRIRGGWNNGMAYTVYFHAIFNKPIKNYTTWKGKKLYLNKKDQFDSGEKTGALVYFKDKKDRVIEVKIGISYISTLKAKQNAVTEISNWNFEEVVGRAEAKWNNILQRIEIDSASTLQQKIMFYTALYHTMLMPVDRTNENPLWTTTEPYYDDFYAIWDTFRSSSPLITLLSPAREVEIINAMLNIYKRDGYLPDARSGNYNGRTQGGSNAEVVIADAFVKGLKGIDYNLAFDAMIKDATVPPGGLEEKEGRGGLTDYNKLGYVSINFVRAGNRTVDYAYNDYCIAEVAKGLDKKKDFEKYLKQSDNWRNLWRADYVDHGTKGFIMPKDALENWVDSVKYITKSNEIKNVKYNPLTREYTSLTCWWCGFFYEGSSWEYSLSIPQDIPAIIQLSGGKEAFIKRLDSFFGNGYYNVANEPSFLTPCLYNWVGRPDLTSDRIRKIVNTFFNSSSSGIPGNDDSGAMSSWLAFHMMGFYPNAGQSYYLLHSPLLKQSILHQVNGKDFKIIANNFSEKNKYIKSATLNGQPFLQAWIEHADIEKGGELIFQMDEKPSAIWGTEIMPPLK